MQCVGSEAASHAFVHDNDTGTGADLPTTGVIYPINRFLIHQEESVTISLHTCLQAIGSSYGPIAAARSAAHKKDALPALRSDDKAGLHYLRKNEDRHCLRLTCGSCRILCHKLLQRATGFADELVGDCCLTAK